MKILSLSEQNIKRISAVELTLDDKGVVIIAGNNEQGKSSLLDGIHMALVGGAAIPAKPVRRGQEKGSVELTLGQIGLPEFTVKRTFTSAGGGALTVTNKEGAKITSPQAMLDSIVGKLSFDPLAFAKMKPAEKAETLRRLLGLDFTKLDNDRVALYDERTDVNRTVSAKRAMLTTNQRYADVPKELLKSDDILKEQEQALAHNNVNAERRRALEREGLQLLAVEKERYDLIKRSEDLNKEIEQLTKLRNEQVTKLRLIQNLNNQNTLAFKKNEQEVAALKDADVSVFRSKLSELEHTNNKIRKNKMVDEIETDFKAASRAADALTFKIDEIDSKKREMIASAKFPLPGMTLGDAGEVLLDNLPFEQASTKGQLMASLAMGAALNPKLRVLFVKSGNDLDGNAMKLLASWAKDNDMQVWLERIQHDGPVAVVIEDGRAVEQPAEPVTEPAAEKESEPAQKQLV